MAASLKDVERWKVEAKENGIKYIISVCDTFDYEDYPVYCKDENELNENKIYYNEASMQKINEIIEIS